MHQQSSETVMARYLEARTGHELAIAALFASLLICLTAAPALAQSVPLPTPRPAIDAHPTTTGSIAAPARPAVPSAALGAPAAGAQSGLQSVRPLAGSVHFHHRAQPRAARHHRAGEQLSFHHAYLVGDRKS